MSAKVRLFPLTAVVAAIGIAATVAGADSVNVRSVLADIDAAHRPSMGDEELRSLAANLEQHSIGRTSPATLRGVMTTPETQRSLAAREAEAPFLSGPWHDARSAETVGAEVRATPHDQLVIVPLPSPILLTGAGLIGAILLRRRVLR